jgi:hypothetical protein
MKNVIYNVSGLMQEEDGRKDGRLQTADGSKN